VSNRIVTIEGLLLRRSTDERQVGFAVRELRAEEEEMEDVENVESSSISACDLKLKDLLHCIVFIYS